MDTIGERLRWARLRRGLSRDSLARASGVESATIGRLETDLIIPGPSAAHKLAQALHIDAAWLLAGSEDKR
jgi:transcriptional regulator with XRE-family HTH domain